MYSASWTCALKRQLEFTVSYKLPQALNECENFYIVTIRREQTTFRIRAIHISITFNNIVLENVKEVWFLNCCNGSKGRPYSLKNKYDRFCRCCLNILHKSYMYTVDNNRIFGWIQNGLLANKIATHSPGRSNEHLCHNTACCNPSWDIFWVQILIYQLKVLTNHSHISNSCWIFNPIQCQ